MNFFQYTVFKVPTLQIALKLSDLLSCFWQPLQFIRYSFVCQVIFTWLFDDFHHQMETERFELLTPCLQGRCSPNWAISPWIWHPPAFPHRLQCSIIGRLRLNHRVRDGYGCFPLAHRHQEFSSVFLQILETAIFSERVLNYLETLRVPH